MGLVWSGLVWSGLVWSGLVWSGLVWSGLVWSGLVWSGLVWSGLVWSGLYYIDTRNEELNRESLIPRKFPAIRYGVTALHEAVGSCTLLCCDGCCLEGWEESLMYIYFGQGHCQQTIKRLSEL